MNVLVVTDNEFMYSKFNYIIENENFKEMEFKFSFSPTNKLFKKRFDTGFTPINLQTNSMDVIELYDLIISLHCKQLFPPEIVNNVRCINIHPGYNPYNRGWFPQVFSILNHLPIGVTIHEMDEELDHGGIIVQEEIEIKSWDTSYDVYKKIQDLEVKMLEENLKDIIDNNYQVQVPTFEGNINLKRDFDKLCKIDLDRTVTFREAIDYFRAVSFKGHKNAYYYDNDRKVYVNIDLQVDYDE